MAIQLGSAYGKVELDASGVQRGVSTSVTNFQKLATMGERLGAAMKRAGTMMTLGITLPILAMGTASIKAASDLEETRNKVSVVFGDMSGEVLAWGEKSAQAFGQSKQQALEAAGTFGNLFTSMGLGTDESAKMSEGLVELAADLASFNNMDPTIVLEKLRSGLVGEVEPLRTLGVNLTMTATKAKAMEMGLADANGEVSQAALVQARYALILEQTSNAQGDFARTSEGLANQSRILKAELQNSLAMLGQNLLPIVLEVVKGLNILLEKFNAAPPFVQRMVISFGVLLALAGPTLSFFGTVISGVSGLIGIMGTAGISITTVGTALSTVGSVIFGTVIPAIGAAIVAALPLILALAAIAAGVYFVYWAFKNNFMGITTTAKQLWFIIKYEFNQGWENIKAKSTEGWIQMNDLFKRGSDSIHEIWLKFTQLLQTLLQLLLNWIVEWARTTVQSIFNMFNVDWTQIGSNIINGIINGLQAMWDDLVALAQEIAQSVLDAFDDVQEMGSPSQAMAKRGMNSALGYMQGMRNGLNPFVVQQLAAMPLQALDSGSHIQQINHFSRGLTTTQAARMMNDSMPVIMDRLAGMLEED